MIFKCKICGGELNVERGQSIVECEYCGVKQTLPKFFDENVKLMYDRANNYLLHSEFDKAENIFNQILFADKEDADAYWSLVLCKYGISYVKDPKTGKYVPTCNRTYYSSVFDDENYKNAIKYANKEKAELFKADAKTIDNIQHGIIAISKKEKPFDIFISYKETASNGGRTKDSIAAQDLYEKLTNEGYKVFFSRITLEDKIGTEYEPYIYAALASSRIMITVCSSKENIESVWVKNEWSRFFSFSQKDSTKTILPLYFDMDKSDLPGEFAHLPSYDMKTDGFEQDLIRGIKKLIPLPIMEKERREKRKKLFKKIGIGAAVCLVIAAICMIPWFMKLPDYNAAMQLYYDKNYPEAAWAFADLGKYRKSQEMKDKCEKSWRKSLATIATENFLSTHSNYGSYYITPNGTVETFNSDPGSSNSNIQVNEHGKVVSIGDNKSLLALYEDGYADNGIQNSEYKWQNIIKISPRFNLTHIALCSDGTMVYSSTENEKINGKFGDKWLEEIENWHDIVDFDIWVEKSDSILNAAIIGIKADGSICEVNMKDYGYRDVLNKFSDIKKIDVNGRDIVALTNHGTVISYIDGVFNESEGDNIIDVQFSDEIINSVMHHSVYYLTKDGRLINQYNSSVIMREVVYINDFFVVTKNGSIYKTGSNRNYEELTKEEGTACIYDEWLERMK